MDRVKFKIPLPDLTRLILVHLVGCASLLLYLNIDADRRNEEMPLPYLTRIIFVLYVGGCCLILLPKHRCGQQ